MSDDISAALIDLSAVHFAEKERLLVQNGLLSVTAFRYDSGVAALRVTSDVGEAILLPFHGQQIWDATFQGRRLTMGSTFTEPVATTQYLSNYGGFMLHCGALAMGNPGPGDTHALHGELPNAPFQEARLIVGSEGGRRYVALAGTYEHRVAFGARYAFMPALRIVEGSGRIGLDFSLRNLRAQPMHFMYLAHINFRPVNGASIIDAVPDEPAHMRLRRRLPEFFTPDEAYLKLVDRILADPGVHREIVAGRIDTELVFGLDYPTGADGWATTLQRLPDGTADFVSHRPAELGHAVRWLIRNGDEDALGLVLPATAEADGYTAEKQKGNVRRLAPGETFTCSLAFGALTKAEADAAQAAIEATGVRR